MHMLRLILSAGTLATLVACSGPDAAQAPGTQAQGASTASAATADAPAATGEGDAALDMARVDRYFAAYAGLGKAAESDPAVGALQTVDEPTKPVEPYIERIAANPKAVAVLSQAGTTPAEYVHTQKAFAVAFVVQQMMESGTITELPPGTDPQAVEFVKKNKQELLAKMQANGLN